MSSASPKLALADRIDRLNTAIGRAAAWAGLFVVAQQVIVVVLRYALDQGSIWLTEAIVYGHGTLIMLAAAWTLLAGGHVRVDVLYADASPRTRAWVDLAGALLLLLHPGAFARDQRHPGGVSALDADPGVRRADGLAGRVAGDPRD